MNEGRREQKGEILRISEVYKKNVLHFYKVPSPIIYFNCLFRTRRTASKLAPKKID